MSTELIEYKEQLNNFLTDTFRQYGVECEVKDGIVIFRREHITAYTKLFEISASTTILLQLDVILKIGVGKEIVESCVGIGIDADAAMKDAWKKFLSNAFHVLLSAFFALESGEQVDHHKWIISGRAYDVFISQMNIRGDVPNPFPMEWYNKLESLIKEQDLKSGIHWIRLFYAQSANETMTCEILLDNEEWKSFEVEAKSVMFPRSNDFLSIRFFMVLQDGLDINRASAILAEIGDEESEVIVGELQKSGMTIDNAEKAEIFIPLAFGRFFLKEMGATIFSNEATIINDRDEEIKISLTDEVIYTEAYRLARKTVLKGGMSQKELNTILSLSSEFNAYNDTLLHGLNHKNIIVEENSSPLIIYLPNYRKKEEFSHRHDGKRRAKKPSWMFWKK